eukprot:652167_1
MLKPSSSSWNRYGTKDIGYILSVSYYCQIATKMDIPKQYNDYKSNVYNKYKNQRVNKYQSSFRKSKPIHIIGKENVIAKLPPHLEPLYSELMHDLHKRDWQHAVHTLQSAIQHDTQCQNLILYTVCLRACCVSGKMDDAKQLYRQMYDQHSIKPDAITLIALLKGCSVIRDWNQSQFWLHKVMKDGNIHQNALELPVYSLMISSANALTWTHAWDLFNRLKEMPHIQMDIIIYNAILDVLARAQQYTLSQRLFMEIRNHKQLKMDNRTFASAVRSCVYDGNVQTALDYIQLMQSKQFNIKVTKHIISDVLRTIKHYQGESDGFALAESLWMQVVGTKIVPDAVLFGIMIDLCCKYNQFDYGLQLFRDMITIYKIHPTTIVFNNLLKCCVAECKSKEYLLSLLCDMKQVYKLEPDQFTYNILLNAMIKLTVKQLHDDTTLDMKQRYVIVTQLLTFWNDGMVLMNEVSYSTLIHALCNINKEYFDNTKNVINRQMLRLYQDGCNAGFLGHWSPAEDVKDEWVLELHGCNAGFLGHWSPAEDVKDEWVLELHGWSVNVARVSLQCFFEIELLNIVKDTGLDNVKHVSIIVGKGKHNAEHVAYVKMHTLDFIRDCIGIREIT